MEKFEFLEMNDNENTTWLNIQNEIQHSQISQHNEGILQTSKYAQHNQAILWARFVALSAYVNTLKTSHINSLMRHLKSLGKKTGSKNQEQQTERDNQYQTELNEMGICVYKLEVQNRKLLVANLVCRVMHLRSFNKKSKTQR